MSESPLSPDQARARRMEPITDPYAQDELWMAHKELARLLSLGIEAALVQGAKGIEIWRTNVRRPDKISVKAPVPGRNYGYNLLRGRK